MATLSGSNNNSSVACHKLDTQQWTSELIWHCCQSVDHQQAANDKIWQGRKSEAMQWRLTYLRQRTSPQISENVFRMGSCSRTSSRLQSPAMWYIMVMIATLSDSLLVAYCSSRLPYFCTTSSSAYLCQTCKAVYSLGIHIHTVFMYIM